MKKVRLFWLAIAHCVTMAAQIPFLDTENAYLGQNRPGETPVIFAPEVLSQSACDNTISFSPNGKELFFTKWKGDNPSLYYSAYNGTVWTTPKEKNFSNSYEMEAIFAPYGKVVWFASGETFPDAIWMVESDTPEWKAPVKIESVCSPDVEFYATLTMDTTLYFQRTWNGIYRSEYQNGAFTTPIKLSNAINSETEVNRHPWISKDETYLLFERGDGSINDDIWISFRTSDTAWMQPVKLSKAINTDGFECQPTLSPDEKYLFFRRDCKMYWVRIDNQIAELRKTLTANSFRKITE